MPFTSGFKKAPIYVLQYSQYILSKRRPRQSAIQNSNVYILIMFYHVSDPEQGGMQNTSQTEIKQQFPQKHKANNNTSPEMLPIFLLCCAPYGTCWNGYEGIRLFSAMPRSQQRSARHSNSKYGSSALTKATQINKISLCRTFLLPRLWKKDYRGNVWKHWLGLVASGVASAHPLQLRQQPVTSHKVYPSDERAFCKPGGLFNLFPLACVFVLHITSYNSVMFYLSHTNTSHGWQPGRL